MRSILLSLALAALGCSATDLGPLESESASVTAPDGGPDAREGPPPREGAPPPEAVDACAGETAGAACSFTDPDGNTVEGTCRACHDEVLACGPAHDGPPPGGRR